MRKNQNRKWCDVLWEFFKIKGKKYQIARQPWQYFVFNLYFLPTTIVRVRERERDRAKT